MKILVTGAAGFIGSHLVERLLNLGHIVTGLDDFNPFYDPAIKRRNITWARAEYGAGGRFEMVEGDFGDRDLLLSLLPQGFEAIVHLAAQAGVRPSLKDPLKYEQNNVAKLINLLEMLREHGPRRIVATSSSSVYGNSTPSPFKEDAACDRPESPYGATKRAGELFLAAYHNVYRFQCMVVRPFTVYGPRQRPDMAIGAFCRKLLLGEPIILYGDGRSARDYTYVEDIVDGLVGALSFPAGFGVYNLGGEHPVMLLELVRMLEKVTGKEAQLRWEPAQAGDVLATSADLSRARRDLGYSPRVSLEEGLRRTAAWVRQELIREGHAL